MEYYNSGMQHISDHLLNAVMPEQREALSETLKVIMANMSGRMEKNLK